MSNQNWQCQEGDPFKPAQPEIDPSFAAAHYGNDLKPVPNCGACPGDGSICATSCKVAEESPPVPTQDITARLRDMQSKKYNHTWSQWVQKQTSLAADIIEAQQQRIAILESEAEQLRMAWKNAEQDAVRFVLFFEAMIADMHSLEMTPMQISMARSFKKKGGDPTTVDEIREIIDAAMTKDAA